MINWKSEEIESNDALFEKAFNLIHFIHIFQDINQPLHTCINTIKEREFLGGKDYYIRTLIPKNYFIKDEFEYTNFESKNKKYLKKKRNKDDFKGFKTFEKIKKSDEFEIERISIHEYLDNLMFRVKSQMALPLDNYDISLIKEYAYSLHESKVLTINNNNNNLIKGNKISTIEEALDLVKKSLLKSNENCDKLYEFYNYDMDKEIVDRDSLRNDDEIFEILKEQMIETSDSLIKILKFVYKEYKSRYIHNKNSNYMWYLGGGSAIILVLKVLLFS